jgi:hypothetical protein
VAAASYRRLFHLPKLVVNVPFVTFAMTTLFLTGLAFSSFANLGVLARQKALVFPFLLLVVCVPALPRRPVHDPEGEHAAPPAERPAETSVVSTYRPFVAAPSGAAATRFVRSEATADDDLWVPRRSL